MLVDDVQRHPRRRRVQWHAEVSRDDLSEAARNSLGSISALFRIRGPAETEILALSEGAEAPTPVLEELVETLGADDAAVGADARLSAPPTAQDLTDQAVELMKDRVAALSPGAMEDFVAGRLRALGYRTIVAPRGPDRARDILATPDPLGLEDPRIHVEVKHRRGRADPAMLRGFLGGRGSGDRRVFVSTSGFIRGAKYEAERAAIPMRAMTLDGLVRLLIAHHATVDTETRTMVPPRRINRPI